jgi:hypothetical protein
VPSGITTSAFTSAAPIVNWYRLSRNAMRVAGTATATA